MPEGNYKFFSGIWLSFLGDCLGIKSWNEYCLLCVI